MSTDLRASLGDGSPSTDIADAPASHSGHARQAVRDRRRSDAPDILRLQRHGVIVIPAADVGDDLIARLIASLRHADAGQSDAQRTGDSLRSFGGWTLDLLERRLVAPDGTMSYLPNTEFALLRVFLEHPHRVLSRTGLANFARSHGRPFRSARTIDSYVSRLRRRLTHGDEAPLIATVWGAGYVLTADVDRRSDADET